jgi:hypothetical protein
MLPNQYSQSGRVALWKSLVYKAQQWVRQQVVDDDPWDQETLFSDSPALDLQTTGIGQMRSSHRPLSSRIK